MVIDPIIQHLINLAVGILLPLLSLIFKWHITAPVLQGWVSAIVAVAIIIQRNAKQDKDWYKSKTIRVAAAIAIFNAIFVYLSLNMPSWLTPDILEKIIGSIDAVGMFLVSVFSIKHTRPDPIQVVADTKAGLGVSPQDPTDSTLRPAKKTIIP